ncbi:MAG: DUF1295 domain-containing protein [Oceanococcus sp.]
MLDLAHAYDNVLIFLSVLAGITFVSGFFITNPYGRHMSGQQRFTMPALPAWLIFEFPQVWAFTVCFWYTAASPTPAAIVLYGLWQSHYIYRAIIYPTRTHKQGRRFPISGVIFGFAFNALNGFANGYAVAFADHLTLAWFSDPRFLAGLLVATSGWWINFQADNILIRLRNDGSPGYKIPHGGLFRWVSSANYLGEILLWCGWALMSWTAAGLIFALFTIANLAPRAIAHHRWYLAQFEDYPRDRKALIPGLL